MALPLPQAEQGACEGGGGSSGRPGPGVSVPLLHRNAHMSGRDTQTDTHDPTQLQLGVGMYMHRYLEHLILNWSSICV